MAICSEWSTSRICSWTVLFLIFISDLDTGIVYHILKFADDTKVFGNINHVSDSIQDKKAVLSQR